MSAAVSASGLRGRADPLALWTFVGSLVVHAGLLVIAMVASCVNAQAPIRTNTKPIVAKLVRLGEKRDANLLPRIDKAPPPPKPAAAVLPPKPDAPVIPKKKVPEAVKEDTPDRSEADLAAAISRIAEQYDPNATAEAPAGDPEGDPGGNASDAGEGDRYLALVQRAVRSHYRIPSIISDRERLFLNATVVIFVSPDGRILRREIETPSGNEHFDSALLSAIDAASPLPPPPEGWRETFQKEGLGLRFKI
ncbi:MAG: energy transducer TonB [Deltaproteobacteria bacterium]|nr:energy transducer TonB [Deltaproteobacteria bacterium]